VDAPEPKIFEPNIRPDCTDELTAVLGRRIMVIDGAMGTAIQRDRPDEAGYRGALAPLAVAGQPQGELDRVPVPVGSGPTSHAGAGVSSGTGAGAA